MVLIAAAVRTGGALHHNRVASSPWARCGRRPTQRSAAGPPVLSSCWCVTERTPCQRPQSRFHGRRKAEIAPGPAYASGQAHTPAVGSSLDRSRHHPSLVEIHHGDLHLRATVSVTMVGPPIGTSSRCVESSRLRLICSPRTCGKLDRRVKPDPVTQSAATSTVREPSHASRISSSGSLSINGKAGLIRARTSSASWRW